jgi:hypothetical protein
MALNRITQEMIKLLPSWLFNHMDEESIGVQTMDTMAIELGDLKKVVDTALKSGFIETADDGTEFDLLNIDYLYKIDLTQAETDFTDLSVQYLANKDEYLYENLERALTLFDFYSINEKYYFDIETYTLYLKSRYQTLRINGILYDGTKLEKHHVWGPLDELGLMIGCPRIKEEENLEYKLRLLDVFENPGNATKDGLTNHIARSLGINKDLIEINSLSDQGFIESLIEEDGSLSKKLKDFIDVSNKVNNFDMNDYWNILDESSIGLKYLPIVWDSGLDKWDINKIQNGIGFGDDLLISKPEITSDIQDFEYALFAEGLAYPDKKVYPEHKFQYKLYSDGHIYESGYSPEEFYYTVVASELVPLQFDVVADKVYYHEYNLDFGDPYVSTSIISPENYHPNEYVKTDNMIVVDGSYIPNKPKRYLQIGARLESSSDKTKSPVLSQISLSYTKGGVPMGVTIEGTDGVTYSDVNKVSTIGFEAVDNWDDTGIEGIRFKQDTNDSYRTEANIDGTLTLTKGDYQKVYDSAGDWDDGIKNKDSVNVRISAQGNLRLSI